MTRIIATILLMAAWHFPTTFFVPQDAPQDHGWLIWPFGKASQPAFEALEGVIAPSTPAAVTSPTIAMALAGISSIAFVIAIAALWAIVIPTEWMVPAALVGAIASGTLFLIYLSPLAIVPLVLDAIVIYGIAVAGWTQATLAEG